MSVISNYVTRPPFEAGKEISIINRREIEPLLAKARQILTHYDEAMDVTTVVLDRSGQVLKPLKSQFCEFCKKYYHNPSQIWQGKKYPCEEIHQAALEKSRQTGKSHVYSCMIGFAYWTSPLYRNRSYTGAITAGQLLLCGRKEAAEKFRHHCKDKIAAEKFKMMLADVPEKSCDEIRAMASILEVCAQEISEKGEDLRKTIRCVARRGGGAKAIKVTVPENQIEKEQLLLAAFQRGDNEAGCKIINELIDGINTGNPENMEMKRIRAIELLVLLSSAATNSETSSSKAIHKANNKNFIRILESKTSKELFESLHFASEQIAGEIFAFRGMRHASVLRKAQRYIWKNLARKISLDEISRAVGLSAPYFSTVFKEEMGENFSNYINRLRVEKAATLLTESGNPIKTIAGLCGFEDQSWFSKIFKSYTGTTPGKYRENGSFAGSVYEP
jgi:AraC-like DNA-binding protein/ligand-binding sensor protein